MVLSAEYIKKKLEQEMVLSQAFGRDLVSISFLYPHRLYRRQSLSKTMSLNLLCSFLKSSFNSYSSGLPDRQLVTHSPEAFFFNFENSITELLMFVVFLRQH